MKVIYIEWLDSSSTHGWQKNIPNSTLKCTSVGYLIDETREKLTMAMSHDVDNNNYCQFMEIPKRVITKKRFLNI